MQTVNHNGTLGTPQVFDAYKMYEELEKPEVKTVEVFLFSNEEIKRRETLKRLHDFKYGNKKFTTKGFR